MQPLSSSPATMAASGAAIEVRACRQEFGTFTALHNVDLAVASGEFVTLLGPSGSGKTTLLRILAGLVLPTGGSVHIGGQDVTYLPTEKRDIGMVFQNYALFPHLTIFENVAFPLLIRKLSRQEITQRVGAALELVGLPSHGPRYPGQLSGGQQQRVAIARALVFRPRVLLMDEPLGSLDKRLRQQLQLEIRKLQKEVGITTVYVTHDQDEAFTISDRIAVMDKGAILQIATPSEIYRLPKARFVADFVGDLNCIEGRVAETPSGLALETSAGLQIPLGHGPFPVGTAVTCGVRPEHIRVGERAGPNALPATLEILRFKGDHQRGEAVLSDGTRLTINLPEDCALREGERTQVGWNPAQLHIFQLG
ncbi:ABC transporter ATP-binding protein [Bosea sp. NPDC055594]